MRRRSLLTAAFVLLLAVAAIVMAGGAGASSSKATDESPDASGIAPSGMVSAGAPRIVNVRSATPVATPARPANAFINRPGIPLSEYLAAKAAAAASHAAAPGKAPQPLSTNTIQGHHELDGENAAGEGTWFPPDINGAVGSTQFATITNDHLSVWSKAPSNPVLQCRNTVNTVLNYTGGTAFDPRIEYDTRWNRWVFTTDSFANSSHIQYLWIAVSLTNNACGQYYTYALNLGTDNSNGSFVDYPQLGLSQDAVIVTFSYFPNASGTGAAQGTRLFAVAKSILYNGQGFSVPIFAPSSGGTLTPPNVIDQNPRVHALLEFPGSGNNGTVYNVLFQNLANGSYGSEVSATPISGVIAPIPPSAPQPGCSQQSCMIDTSDGRFINDPTQYDIHLWAANTVALGSFSVPHWYDIWTEGANKNTVNQGGYAYMANNSFDWNASIAALAGGRAIMTASWDDATATNPSMWMTGRIPTDAANAINQPTNVYTSPSTLTGNYDSRFGVQRWGDTSSVRFEAGTARAWAFNETVQSGGSQWSSHEGVLSLS